MTTFTLSVLVVVAFAGILQVLNLVGCAQEVHERGMDCLRVIRDPSMTDAAKETHMQRNARRLFALLGTLTGGSMLALALPLALVWLLSAMDVASFSSVLAFLQRADFLAGTIFVGMLGTLLVRHLRAP
jgi:hypothetical protein